MFPIAANRSSQITESDQSSDENELETLPPTARESAVREIAANSRLVIENNGLTENFAIRVASLRKPVIKVRNSDQPLPSDIWPLILRELPVMTILDLAATCKELWKRIGVSGQESLPMLIATQGQYADFKIDKILDKKEVLNDDKQVVQNIATLADKCGYVTIRNSYVLSDPPFDPLLLAGLQSSEKMIFLKIKMKGKCLADIPVATLRNDLKSISALKIALYIFLSKPKSEDFKAIGVLLNDLKKDCSSTALRTVWISLDSEKNNCLNTSPEYLKLEGGLDNKKGADNVADLLAANHTLQAIDLSYAGVEPKNAKEIATALHGHPSIRTVDIRGNYVGSKGIVALKKAASPNMSIMASEKTSFKPYDSHVKVRCNPVGIAARKAAKTVAKAPSTAVDKFVRWLHCDYRHYPQGLDVSTTYYVAMRDSQLTNDDILINKSSDSLED